MFQPLANIIPGALDRLKVRRPLEASIVCRAADKALSSAWDHAVPMRAVSYRSGVVTVAVTSSAWAHEVLMRAEPLKDTTNKALGGAPVKRIKTRVAPNAARGQENL